MSRSTLRRGASLIVAFRVAVCVALRSWSYFVNRGARRRPLDSVASLECTPFGGGRIVFVMLCLAVHGGCSQESSVNRAAAPPPAVVLSASDIADLRRDAQIAFSSGKYEQAVDLFTRVSELSHDDYDCLLWRARAHERLSDAPAAAADVALAIQRAPKAPEPYLHRAQLNYQRGDTRAAIADCDRVIANDNGRVAGAYGMRSGLHLKNRDYQLALSDCNEAIRRDPELVPAYNNRALVYEALNHSGRLKLPGSSGVDVLKSNSTGPLTNCFNLRPDFHHAAAPEVARMLPHSLVVPSVVC